MNLIEQARQAYAPAKNPLRTNRSTEHQIFSDVTARLRRAALVQPEDFPRLVAALHDNRQLWTLLAADVADDANALPSVLRAQIFYLADFTSYHTGKILRGQARVEPLIEINTAMMRGLSGNTGEKGGV